MDKFKTVTGFELRLDKAQVALNKAIRDYDECLRNPPDNETARDILTTHFPKVLRKLLRDCIHAAGDE
jgi:hypothetical protein